MVDLGLVIDESGSIKDGDPEHWEHLMSFVRKVVDGYAIGLNLTRLAGACDGLQGSRVVLRGWGGAWNYGCRVLPTQGS